MAITGLKSLAPKVIDIAGLGPLVYNYDVVFDGADIYNGTGFNTIDGPFSILISVDNQCTSPLLVGLVLSLRDRDVLVADRQHIGFVATSKSAVVSGASVPQLSNIVGVVTKITVKVYRFPLVTSTGAKATVSVKIDAPGVISAPQTIIGSDEAVIEPGRHASFEGVVTLVAGSTSTVILDTTVVPPPFAIKITDIDISIPATPSFPADVVCRTYLLLGGVTLKLLAVDHSYDDSVNDVHHHGDWLINIGDKIQILGGNSNTDVSRVVTASMFGEFVMREFS